MGFNEDKLSEGYRQKERYVGIDLAMELDNLRRHLAQVEWTFSISPGITGGWDLDVFDMSNDFALVFGGIECPTILHAITAFRQDDACPPDRENL